jgi:lipopolysaccharide assembly LptE-like protein
VTPSSPNAQRRPRRSGLDPRRALIARALLVSLVCLSSGCYSIGYEADPSLGDLIAVPIFRNETLRRGLEHDLTRDLRREILETTPLHLTPADPLVPVLRGTIERVDEEVLVAGAREEVLYGSVRIAVRFGVYRGRTLLIGADSDGDGVPDGELRLEGLAERDTARGEDRLSAGREALRDLAEMIALELQGRRDDRYEPNDDAESAALLRAGRQHALVQRESDWFRVEVPARQRLRAVLYHSADLRFELRDARGEALSGVEVRGERRLLEWIGGVKPTTVTLHVSGGDASARYQLALELFPDDGAEPNQGPEEASALAPGAVVRGIARDEDWYRLEQPAAAALLIEVEADPSEPPLTLEVTDPDALPLGEGEVTLSRREGKSLLRVEPSAKARTLYLRLGGAREDPTPYRLRLGE